MGKETSISWTDSTFNIAWGCVKVSPGCVNCYADVLSARTGQDIWGPTKPRKTFGAKHWNDPLRWHKKAVAEGKQHKVFCSSMCDIFEDHPTITAERAKLWPLIKSTPSLTWQLLTKRADRIADNLPADWGKGYPNVWLGASVENADYAWRIDQLRMVPAKVRFVSYEPAVGPLAGVDLTGIHWLIYGGESGAGFRKDDLRWASDMRDQCAKDGVAFFFKQTSGFRSGLGKDALGEVIHEFPRG